MRQVVCTAAWLQHRRWRYRNHLMIPIHEAQQTVIEACAVLPALPTACEVMNGRVLAQDVVAPENVPPFTNTAVDGYAVRAADVQSVPVVLRVVDTLAAGAAPTVAVGSGEAIRIMTGAPMPQGADAVVMVEDSVREGDVHVSLSRAAKVGDGIRDAGSDVRVGETVFVAGTVLNAAGAGVLASVNARSVLAYPRARVALLSTGDELVTDGSPLRIGQIRESNLTMLDAMIAASGCEVNNLGVVRDDEIVWLNGNHATVGQLLAPAVDQPHHPQQWDGDRRADDEPADRPSDRARCEQRDQRQPEQDPRRPGQRGDLVLAADRAVRGSVVEGSRRHVTPSPRGSSPPTTSARPAPCGSRRRRAEIACGHRSPHRPGCRR